MSAPAAAADPVAAAERRPSDAELVAAVLAGRREAYAELVGRHQDLLYRHALGMLGDGDLAADLVQDTFVAAFERLRRCRHPERFRSWVFTILRNRCRDHLKNIRRRTVRFEEHAATVPAGDDPLGEMVESEFLARVRAALQTLPSAQREAFLLKHVEDCSYEEISAMLGVGVSALKMRVLRAREALRTRLGATQDDDR